MAILAVIHLWNIWALWYNWNLVMKVLFLYLKLIDIGGINLLSRLRFLSRLNKGLLSSVAEYSSARAKSYKLWFVNFNSGWCKWNAYKGIKGIEEIHKYTILNLKFLWRWELMAHLRIAKSNKECIWISYAIIQRMVLWCLTSTVFRIFKITNLFRLNI